MPTDEPEGHEDIVPQEATSGKRKPKWLQDTLKEAKQSIGEPKKMWRESKAPERFCSNLAMVANIVETEPTTFEEATVQ